MIDSLFYAFGNFSWDVSLEYIAKLVVVWLYFEYNCKAYVFCTVKHDNASNLLDFKPCHSKIFIYRTIQKTLGWGILFSCPSVNRPPPSRCFFPNIL